MPLTSWSDIKSIDHTGSDYTATQKNVLRFTLWTGCRTGEVCNAAWKDIDLKKRTFHIRESKTEVERYVPYSDGTTHVIFEPLDFIAKLAALVPKPRVNLTRFHGVFAPNSKHRVDVTPAKRGKGRPHEEHEDKTPEQRHQAMTWALRLKRVFNIDVSVCPKCGGEARVIASIEDQAVIDKILAHLMKKGALPPPPELLPATRASPDSDWFA